MNKKIYSALSKSLCVISFCATALIFILNFIYTASVSYDAYEVVTIIYSILPAVIMTAVAAGLFFALKYLKKYIERINENILFLVLSLLYVGAAVYLLLNVDHSLRSDAYQVSSAAKSILDGSLNSFKAGGYLNRYPHQIGLALYNCILYLFTRYAVINFIANFLFVLGINYLSFKISNLLFGDKFANILTIFFAFAFLPQFFFILFAYGLIPGFFFITLAFYNTLKFTKNHKWINLIALVLSVSAAVLLKKNFMIGGLAIIIFLILNTIRKCTYKYFISIVLLILCIFLPSNMLTSYFLNKANTDSTAGTPSVLWIAMGIDIDNHVRGPGWYDYSNYTIFTQSGYDPEIAAEIGKEKLSYNIEKIKNEPLKALKFFKDKTVSLWCEPMYQSAWSGPLEACNQYTYTDLLDSIYNGRTAENAIETFSRFEMLVIWALLTVFLIKYRHKTDGWHLSFLFFVGGLLFHTVWEGKSQYIYPYFFSLIPFAAYSLSLLTLKNTKAR